jgi:hypothetical protein
MARKKPGAVEYPTSLELENIFVDESAAMYAEDPRFSVVNYETSWVAHFLHWFLPQIASSAVRPAAVIKYLACPFQRVVVLKRAPGRLCLGLYIGGTISLILQSIVKTAHGQTKHFTIKGTSKT